MCFQLLLLVVFFSLVCRPILYAVCAIFAACLLIFTFNRRLYYFSLLFGLLAVLLILLFTVCCCSFISINRCNAVTLTFEFAARVGRHCSNNMQAICSTYEFYSIVSVCAFVVVLAMLVMYSCHKHFCTHNISP